MKQGILRRGFCRVLPEVRSSALQPDTFEQAHPFPFKLAGVQGELPPRESFSFEQIIAIAQIPLHLLTQYLERIFLASLTALLANDFAFLGEYGEKLFVERCRVAMAGLSAADFSLRLVDDDFGDFGAPVPAVSEIVDAMVFRGLSTAREQNGAVSDYSVWQDQENMGLTVYTHRSLQTSDSFVGPAGGQALIDRYNRAVLRVLLKVKTPKLLKVRDGEGRELFVGSKRQTWTHSAIFETDLLPSDPLKSRYKLENYQEWLYRYKPARWLLVDADNFMRGNPLFLEAHARQKFDDPVFHGSELDPASGPNIRNFNV